MYRGFLESDRSGPGTEVHHTLSETVNRNHEVIKWTPIESMHPFHACSSQNVLTILVISLSQKKSLENI